MSAELVARLRRAADIAHLGIWPPDFPMKVASPKSEAADELLSVNQCLAENDICSCGHGKAKHFGAFGCDYCDCVCFETFPGAAG